MGSRASLGTILAGRRQDGRVSVGHLRSRPYLGPADLRAMGRLLSEAWLGPGRPLVSLTVGDLEWWTALGGPGADWPRRIRLWEIGDELVAFGWFKPPRELEWFVADRVPSDERRAILDELFDWHAAAARAGLADTATRPPGDAGSDPRDLQTWAGDGWPEAAELEVRGWIRGDVLLSQYHQPLDRELDPPRVPDGYVLRTMRGPDDIAARVEVHRAAFVPSALSVEKYELLVRQPHYAFGRDVVIEGPGGSFAAFALCWADDVGSIGEFEPVGVHPDHQRRGLGRVVMRHGLRLLREAGLRDVIVFSLGSNAASEALYRSAGFDRVATHRAWTKPLDPAPPIQSTG